MQLCDLVDNGCFLDDGVLPAEGFVLLQGFLLQSGKVILDSELIGSVTLRRREVRLIGRRQRVPDVLQFASGQIDGELALGGVDRAVHLVNAVLC